MEFNQGDLIQITIPVQCITAYKQIPNEVDDEGNVLSTKGAWVLIPIQQEVIYTGQEFTYLGSTSYKNHSDQDH